MANDNFLVTILNRMFSYIRNNKDKINPQLTSRIEKFAAHLSQKFHWVFDDEEDEEDKPVVVLDDTNTECDMNT